jgi:hypothetical protein
VAKNDAKAIELYLLEAEKKSPGVITPETPITICTRDGYTASLTLKYLSPSSRKLVSLEVPQNPRQLAELEKQEKEKNARAMAAEVRPASEPGPPERRPANPFGLAELRRPGGRVLRGGR